MKWARHIARIGEMSENLMARDNLEDSDIDRMIILEWILEKK